MTYNRRSAVVSSNLECLCHMQCCPCASVATAKDGEDEEEEVDDVKVEIEGSEDVLLWGN